MYASNEFLLTLKIKFFGNEIVSLWNQKYNIKNVLKIVEQTFYMGIFSFDY